MIAKTSAVSQLGCGRGFALLIPKADTKKYCYELIRIVKEVSSEDAVETLVTLVQGKRLKDISNLPQDLSV